jgi:hypothetical protein
MAKVNQIIENLHKLYTQTFDGDNFDMNIALMSAYLNKIGLHFIDEKPETWVSHETVEDHFYDVIVPGKVLSLTAFEYACRAHLDFDFWMQVQAVQGSFEKIKATIEHITYRQQTFPQYGIVAIVDTFNGLTSKPAA